MARKPIFSTWLDEMTTARATVVVAVLVLVAIVVDWVFDSWPNSVLIIAVLLVLHAGRWILRAPDP